MEIRKQSARVFRFTHFQLKTGLKSGINLPGKFELLP